MLGFSHTLNVMYRVRAGAVEDVCVCVCVHAHIGTCQSTF